jgi:DNA primase
LDAEPLNTPEAWAGLKQRLIDHAAQIQHPDLSRMYREDWLRRFYELRRPKIAAGALSSAGSGQFQGKGKGLRWTTAPPPVGEHPRSIGKTGIDPTMIAPLLAGCIRYPRALLEHFELVSELQIDDRQLSALRDVLIHEIVSNPQLETAELKATLSESGLAELVKTNLRADRMPFSFNQKDMPVDRAVREFGAVIKALIEKGILERTLEEVTRELGQELSEEKFEEQTHARASLGSINERLASLAGTD